MRLFQPAVLAGSNYPAAIALRPLPGHLANCPSPLSLGNSVISLKNKAALQKANITHVVSVLRMRPDENLTEGFQTLKIEVDDVDDEDLLQYFATANAFIQAGLDAGGGVLVHWYCFNFHLPLLPMSFRCPFVPCNQA